MSHGEVDCCSSAVTPASIVSAAASADPIGRRLPLWNSKEYFLDCLVVALEVRRTTEDDGITAYFAGHERFSMNPNDCDTLGPGAYNAPGVEGLRPADGVLYLNSAGTAGYYSRARGLGADDMLATSAGLWIASDNSGASQMCGGVQNLSGICFLPYS